MLLRRQVARLEDEGWRSGTKVQAGNQQCTARQATELFSFFQGRNEESEGRRSDGSVGLCKCQALLACLVGRYLLGRLIELLTRRRRLRAGIGQMADRMAQSHLLRTEQQQGQDEAQEE